MTVADQVIVLALLVGGLVYGFIGGLRIGRPRGGLVRHVGTDGKALH